MSPLTLQRSARLSRLPGICMAFALGSVAYAGGIACDDPNNCQLPDQMGHGPDGTVAATSDLNPNAGFVVAENFAIDAGGTITDLCWWGTYTDFVLPCADGDVDDNFTITFRKNDPGCPAGAPGTILAGPFSPVVTKIATGNVIPSGLGDLVEYLYTANIPGGVVVGAGECVWLEIVNDTTGGVCVWLWETAEGDGGAFQSGDPTNFDLAFCLNLPLGDTSVCTLPVNPLCEGAQGDCGQANGSPGCDDPCCCTLVCDPDLGGDPSCCLFDWDAQCALAALVCLGDCDTCGLPNCGDCFDNNQTPFCNDECSGVDCVGCCDTICAVDPFCCDNFWDQICANEAEDICGCDPKDAPMNDDCDNALPIFLGATPYTTICASTDGPMHDVCDQDPFFPDPNVALDVWYEYTAGFTGSVRISTCDSADYNAKMAIYDGCACPVTEADLIECNDNGPNCLDGTGSEIIFEVQKGLCYKIRVGGYIAASGVGTINLEALDIPDACIDGQGVCHEGNGSPGCDDMFCCFLVCKTNPDCCDVEWVQACADAAITLGCAFVPVPTCDPEGTAVGDNIGGDASSLLGGLFADQIFPDDPTFDIVALDDFTVGGGGFIATCMDVSAAGFNGFEIEDWNLVESWSVEIYSSPQAAAANLTGDVASLVVPAPLVEPFGDNDLLRFDLTGGPGPAIQLAPGTYWVGVIPTMPGINGQIGIAPTSIGNSDAWQANPNGGFGFPDNLQQIAGGVNLAYRLVGTELKGNPCPADFDLSGAVDVKDLLFLLGAWGPCPKQGDCPADFDLSGAVDVKDLLFLLGAWGPCP